MSNILQFNKATSFAKCKVLWTSFSKTIVFHPNSKGTLSYAFSKTSTSQIQSSFENNIP